MSVNISRSHVMWPWNCRICYSIPHILLNMSWVSHFGDSFWVLICVDGWAKGRCCGVQVARSDTGYTMLLGYVLGYLVNTMLRELGSGTLSQIKKATLCDRWRQHGVNVKDSSIVRHVTPCTDIGVLYQFTRCHIKRTQSSYCSLSDPQILICDYSLRKGWYTENHSVGTATRYGLVGPGIESPWGRVFHHPSRPGLGPIQPPKKWVACLPTPRR